MTGAQIVEAVIEILVSGLTEFATGIGAGLQALVNGVFFVTIGEGSSATTSLSYVAVITAVFAAISLTIGLSKKILNWVGSFGGRNL